MPPFLRAPEPITDVIDVKDYDVVVVGAGTAGMAAANKAAEEGAKVAVVQKLAMASTQGFNAAGLITEDASVRAAFVSKLMLLNDLRSKRSLLEAYAATSGEAIMWYRDLLTKAGCELPGEDESGYVRDCNGYEAEFMTAKPAGTHAAAISMAADYSANANGIDFFYEMPGVQLVKDGNAVTGVICGTEGAYAQFNAAKGVILCTGDYQCNKEMLAYYCPDALDYPPLVSGRTGDGHCMGVWAGGQIEPICHTKMIHDVWMNFAPYLMVWGEGARFCDEHIPWFRINNLMRPLLASVDNPDDARVFSIMDADYLAQAQGWGEYDPEIQAEEVVDRARHEARGHRALIATRERHGADERLAAPPAARHAGGAAVGVVSVFYAATRAAAARPATRPK